MINTYEDAVQFLYQNLPIFQRVGAAAYKPDLTNTIKLCEAFGNPQKRFKSIHVAGTNGKGSTSHMLASVLQSSGYKTGLYTSPHLKSFTERIKINGEDVSEEFVVDFVKRVHPHIASIKPSFFEITVVMAFEYFAVQKVDVAVIEVGLGGRLDSTNVITPDLSVITNIGWDHKDLLGDSLEKIAGEKAGIIKPGIPVVVSERQSEVAHVFEGKARQERSKLYFASDELTVTSWEKHNRFNFDVFRGTEEVLRAIPLPLQGLYQQKNLAGVIKSISVLRDLGYNISDIQLKHGLEHVTLQTKLKGRWQKLSVAPLMICDTAHNIDGVREVVKQINMQKVARKHIVWGMVKDKDVSDILALLPQEAEYYFCQASIPRAMEAELLAEKAIAVGLHGVVCRDVNSAIRTALFNASENDLVFIGGSTFVVAEIEGL